MGVPELTPPGAPATLLSEGIYSRIRHPRYVQIVLGLLGHALLANYLATWIIFAVSLLWIELVTRVEERELRDRFGEEYRLYCEKVPRFFPRSRSGSGSGS